MPSKLPKVGAVYLVDSKNFAPAVLKRYRDIVSDSEKKSEVVKLKVLSHVAGSRSYECQVLGLRDKVKLSGKSLSHLDPSGSRQQAKKHAKKVF
jgi:hypothetical protein